MENERIMKAFSKRGKLKKCLFIYNLSQIRIFLKCKVTYVLDKGDLYIFDNLIAFYPRSQKLKPCTMVAFGDIKKIEFDPL